jgi:hypothetical protein
MAFIFSGRSRRIIRVCPEREVVIPDIYAS